jgi:hypothetical protein
MSLKYHVNARGNAATSSLICKGHLMFDVQPWNSVDQLVLGVGGGDALVSETIARIGPARVADTLVSEILTRWDPPVLSYDEPISLVLHSGDDLFRYVASFKNGQLSIAPGSSKDAVAEIRYSLLDLTRLVYAHRDNYQSTSCEVQVLAWPMQKKASPEDLAKAMQASHLDRAQMARAAYEKGSSLFQTVHSILNACSGRLPSMDHLGALYGGDKWGCMNSFGPHYEQHLSSMRSDPVRVLEIGIGGFEFEALGGGSLYLWQRFFPRGLIYGLDIFKKTGVTGPRIRTIQGDQSDRAFLTEMAEAIGPFDVIVDDGSHVNEHVRASFETLFPYVRPGGYYVIEDLQTAYWPEFGGELPPGSPRTTAGLLKDIIDQIHFREYAEVSDEEARRAIHPSELSVYHDLAFLRKGVTAEPPSPDWIRMGAKVRNERSATAG